MCVMNERLELSYFRDKIFTARTCIEEESVVIVTFDLLITAERS